MLVKQCGRSGKQICCKVEKSSLRDIPWEQIRWAKSKAALTTLCSRLGYLALIQLLHPHLGLLAGEGAHHAPTKRLKATVIQFRIDCVLWAMYTTFNYWSLDKIFACSPHMAVLFCQTPIYTGLTFVYAIWPLDNPFLSTIYTGFMLPNRHI